jgi:ribonuclease VapC
MIVDTSAVVAIVRKEPDRSTLLAALDRDSQNRMSAASLLEAAIVIDGSRDPFLSRGLDDFLQAADIAIEPVTERQARIAREAYRDFGKGSGHAAGLNFGDCFAYALAKVLDEPLLFKGNDFAHTDVRRAAD